MEAKNSAGQGNWADFTVRQARAVATHEPDFTRHAGWTRPR